MGALKMDSTGVDTSPNSSSGYVNWRGRSGTFYALAPGCLQSFAFLGSELHVLAQGSRVLWVGSANELVSDAAKRERFRQAMAEADAVYSLVSPTDEGERLTLAWDLEGAERMGALSLA